jgi:hypothetical protein
VRERNCHFSVMIIYKIVLLKSALNSNQIETCSVVITTSTDILLAKLFINELISVRKINIRRIRKYSLSLLGSEHDSNSKTLYPLLQSIFYSTLNASKQYIFLHMVIKEQATGCIFKTYQFTLPKIFTHCIIYV